MSLLRSKVPGRWGIAFAGAALTALVGIFFLIPGLGRGLTNLSYDLPFLFRANVPTPEAVVIYMDIESHSKLQQDKWQRWDRRLHAKLVNRLTELGARAVAFDILFDAADTNHPAADAELVQAVRHNGKVALAALLVPEIYEGQVIGSQLRPPFLELESATTWGVVAVSDADFAIRKHYQRRDYKAPSLAWRTMQRALGANTNGMPEPFQERWLNFYGPPGMLPHLSYWEVLDSSNPALATMISNRVVFVGALYDIGMTGGKGTDDFRTPYSRWGGTRSAGVEINATACLNLLRRDWLSRTSAFTEFVMILLCGFGCGLVLSIVGPLRAVGLAVFGMVLTGFAADYIVWHQHVWFPWLIVAGVQIPSGMAWSVLAHARRLAGENQALAKAVALASVREEAAGKGAFAAPPVASREAPSESQVDTSHAQAISVPNYTLVRRIGQGAYGEVWLARDIVGRYHAAKIVHRRHFSDAAPFDREFNGIRRYTPISMGHPGMVRVLHVGRNDRAGYIYYIMELADDETRRQAIDPETYSPKNLAKTLQSGTSMPLVDCVRTCMQLADALDYLHRQNLIHRDIKPSNIIFVDDIPKLADIGLVTQVATVGQDVSYLGTEGYIPPEGPGTPLADIYSLGKVIYEAATGFSVRRFPELPSAVLAGTADDGLQELNKIVVRACEFNPKRRYPSAAELHAALAALWEKLNQGSKS